GTVTNSSASRVNSTTTTHTGMYPAMTKVTGTTATRIRSAIGSSRSPQVDRMFHNRAILPSSQSETTTTPRIHRANVGASHTSTATTSTGMSAIRAREIAL